MAGQSPRDFTEWMQKMERQSAAAMRNSSRAVQGVKDVVQKELEGIDIPILPGTPAAPVELTAQASLYTDETGRKRGRIDVDFPDVTRAMDGKAVTVRGYEMYAYREDQVPTDAEPTWELFGTSDTSAITRLDLPQNVAYIIRVRAMEGLWSSTIRVQTGKDTTAPPQPTAPQAQAGRGTIIVEWNGLATVGDMPADFSHVILAASTEPSPGVEDQVARLDYINRTFIMADATYYTPIFFRLAAVDLSGNISPWSEQATAFTTPLVDTDVILTEIDAAKTKIMNAGQIEIEEDLYLFQYLAATEDKLTGPGGLTDRLTEAEELLRNVGAGDTAELARQIGENTTAIDLTKADLSALAGRVSPLEVGLTAVETALPSLQLSINGKNAVIRSRADAGSPEDYKLGDTWEKWSDLGVGGKLLQAWRHDGVRWVLQIMDPTYLPQIDIGSGTFGELTGGRLTVGSVAAKSLLIGSSTNIIPNGAGEWGQAGAWATGLTWDPVDKPAGLPGSFYGPKGSVAAGATYFDVEPSTEYRFEVWLKADKPGSMFFMELRDGSGHATTNVPIPGLPSASSNVYPVGSYIVPTEWTKLTGVTKTNPTTNKLRVGNLYFNHTSGTEYDATVRIAGLRLIRRNEGSLLVDGTVGARQVHAEEVAGAVGQFVKADIGNLVVTGTANLQTAVADRLFANIFATNKLTASQIYVGEGGNLFGASLTDPAWSQNIAGVTYHADGGQSGGESIFLPATSTQTGTYFGIGNVADRVKMPKLVQGQKYRVRANFRSESGRIPVAAVSVYARLYGPTGTGYTWASPSAISNTVSTVKDEWAQIDGIFEVPAGSANLYLSLGLYVQMTHTGNVRFSDVSVQEAITPELIVDGAVTARTITASEEMSAKVGQFLKIDVGNLTATGLTTLNTAVVESLWTSVVRSRQITTDMLTIGNSDNLVYDPGARNVDLTNLRGGLGTSSGLIFTRHVWPDGQAGWAQRAASYGSLSLTGNGAGFGSAAAQNDAATVQEGTTVYAEIEVQIPTTATLSNWDFVCYMKVVYVDGTDAFVNIELKTAANAWATNNNVLTKVFGTKVVGKSASGSAPTKITFGIGWRYGFDGTGTPLLRNPVIYFQKPGSMIVNGSILTKHLTVTEDMTVALLNAHKITAGDINVNNLTADTGFIGGLTTNLLKANSITVTMLNANSVTADKIAAAALTAKHTVTGALVRTAASGARTEMTKDGLRVLDAAGTELVKLGYGLTTGMAVRNPYANEMVSLQSHVFGTKHIQGTTDPGPLGNHPTQTLYVRVPPIPKTNSAGRIVKLYEERTYSKPDGYLYNYAATFVAASKKHLLTFQIEATVQYNQASAGFANNLREPTLPVWMMPGVRAVGSTGAYIWSYLNGQYYGNIPYSDVSTTQRVMFQAQVTNLVVGTEYEIFLDVKNWAATTGATIWLSNTQITSVPI